jgi:hypothetical protein
MDMRGIRRRGNSRTSLQDTTINFADDFASPDLDSFFRAVRAGRCRVSHSLGEMRISRAKHLISPGPVSSCDQHISSSPSLAPVHPLDLTTHLAHHRLPC